ncbi:hypothetical protein [Oceanobacillus sp. FSL H7-0719]|uniref:hypothetical protein n=1 Tax=Oceanobacillus sp. FSL H7-0719 TaxID=2954507 RepID=UPI003248479F
MKKRIEAYFKSENDVETAKTALQQLHVQDIIIDDIPEEGNKIAFVPFVQSGLSWGVAASLDLNQEEKKEEEMTHVLEGKVKAEEYDKAIAILSEKEGYMRRE